MRLYEPTEITDDELFRRVRRERRREQQEEVAGLSYPEIEKTVLYVRKAAGRSIGKWHEGITLSDLPLSVRMFLKSSEGKIHGLLSEAERSPAEAVGRWHAKGQEFVDSWQQEWVNRMKAEQAARFEVQRKKAREEAAEREQIERAYGHLIEKEDAAPEEGRRKIAVKVAPPVDAVAAAEELKPSGKPVAEKPDAIPVEARQPVEKPVAKDQPDGLFIRGEDDFDPGIAIPATVDDLLAAVDDEPPIEDAILASSDVPPPLTIDELTEAMEAGGSAADFLPPFGEDDSSEEGDSGSGEPEIIEGEEIVGADEIEGIQSDFDDHD